MIASKSAWSESQTVRSFKIESGIVQTEAAFCIQAPCDITSSILSGSFQGLITEDGTQLFFPNAMVSTDPDVGFQLPANPDEDSGGTTRRISFSFDGTRLKVEGEINASAFDGPIVRYQFLASSTAMQPTQKVAYFTAYRDLRECIYPLCGGYFVKAVNSRTTLCPDGTRQNECYVSDIRFPKPILDTPSRTTNTSLFLVGQFGQKEHNTYGEIGVFNAKEVQYSATEKPAIGRFFGVKNLGIFCITTPCFGMEQSLLNDKETPCPEGGVRNEKGVCPTPDPAPLPGPLPGCERPIAPPIDEPPILLDPIGLDTL
ncbi:MAG: hypothetical protein P8144_11475 [Gammaproteobacteria bacterium]